jgi:hypothetical protein
MKNKTILLISPEAWGANFVSKHHYAASLAKDNIVFFLEPVKSSKVDPFGHVNVNVVKVNENLFRIDYKNLLPRLNNLPRFVQRILYKKQAKQIQGSLKINEFDVVWSFDPYRFWDLNWFKTKKKIYHAVDVHRAKFEKDIAQSADLVVIVSQFLRGRFRTIKNVIA